MAVEALSERLPTEAEAEIASEAVRAMAKSMTEADGALKIKISENSEEVRVTLPQALGELVIDLLSHVASGEMVTFVPYGAELTTQQAADLLNVSRPHLIKLLDAEEIEHYKVGSHRRVRSQGIMAYKIKRDATRSSALSRLQRLGQEFDAG
ncbi:excisionase family DNA-binding protein [Nisaea nitritireducens]|uniref:excisionase family DNA-binding protein n=1 Tax=Nisaea nitritireducens TaxID=568392 RepID=UPI0018675268|nr:excisionase family DNA-binding protein [Nisaea nitritireducens]